MIHPKRYYHSCTKLQSPRLCTGRPLGPPLKDMSEEEVLKLPITRMTFLRLSAQTYNKLANQLGPLMFSTKVLSSRAFELASVNELNVDLYDRDPDFVNFCRQFIMSLRKVEDILPFPRCWTPSGYELMGFITSLDGVNLDSEPRCMHSRRRYKKKAV